MTTLQFIGAIEEFAETQALIHVPRQKRLLRRLIIIYADSAVKSIQG